MTGKRKASGDAPGTSPPPARTRAASSDGDDVSHGGEPGSAEERRRVEVEPLPQPLPMAGVDANLTDSSGRIDSFAPGTSQPPARMRAASTDGDDVSHGGGLGSGGERKMVEVVVPTPQPLAMAGMDANLTDSSGRIDSFARAVDEEAPSPSRNGEELAAAAGQPEPPPPPSYQPVEAAEAPQPLPNDELEASGDAPGLSQPPAPRSEAENNERMFTVEELHDNLGDATRAQVAAVIGLLRLQRAFANRGESTDGGSSSSEQEEVTSSAPASPSWSEEQLAAAAAQATGHHVDQPAEADAQPLPSDDESVASAEVMDPAADSEDSDHLGSP